MLLTADGRRIPIIKYVVPFTFQGRDCLLETFIDNSDRKKAHDDLQLAYQQLSDAQEKLRTQYDELAGLKGALEVSETKFRTIIETSPDMICDLTADGTFTYISPRCTDILGYSVEELIGRSVISCIAPAQKENAEKILRSGMTRESGLISLDFPFIHKDGRERIINIRSSHLLDDSGTRTGYRCVARDVTEQVRSMKELHEQTLQIKRLSDQKDLFLNQLAHDLRTPLTPIIGMGSFLEEAVTDPDAKELITIFLNSIDYLQKMSEDILVMAQLNRVNNLDTIEPHDLSRLIADAVEANQYLADQKELTFQNQVPPGMMVLLSKPFAFLVFRNLVNNAVKYNAPRGTVRISAKETEESVTVSIADTGIGILPDIRERIWDEFFTGDPARNDPLSKGFGLSIVKRIVELHKGSIEVFSEGYLKGSTFTLSLPKASGADPDTAR
jgi:PAS domain S-box-containing protein